VIDGVERLIILADNDVNRAGQIAPKPASNAGFRLVDRLRC
jgi:hypothetical protein